MGLKGKIFKFMSDFLKDGSYYKLYTQAKSTSACGLPKGFFNLQTLEDLENFGRENGVSHLVWLKENEKGFARVRSWERDKERYIEKKMSVGEVVDTLLKAASRISPAEAETPTPKPASSDPSLSVVRRYLLILSCILAGSSSWTRLNDK